MASIKTPGPEMSELGLCLHERINTNKKILKLSMLKIFYIILCWFVLKNEHTYTMQSKDFYIYYHIFFSYKRKLPNEYFSCININCNVLQEYLLSNLIFAWELVFPTKLRRSHWTEHSSSSDSISSRVKTDFVISVTMDTPKPSLILMPSLDL